MTESVAMLLAATVGMPCALLALAVVHHARVVSRMPAADEGWDPEDGDELTTPFSLPVAPATTAYEPDSTMVELQRTVTELQAQLARQRDALTGLLSEQRRAVATRTAPTSPAAEETHGAPGTDATAVAPADLGSAVRDLSAEGLSDRAIARRLRVGLEEVRLLSRRRELAS